MNGSLEFVKSDRCHCSCCKKNIPKGTLKMVVYWKRCGKTSWSFYLCVKCSNKVLNEYDDRINRFREALNSNEKKDGKIRKYDEKYRCL